jgi:hypothetical protein
VVRDIQDHRAYAQLPYHFQTCTHQVGSDAPTPTAGLDHEPMQISQLTNGLDRDHGDRMLGSSNQDRPMRTEQLAPPAALTPLLRSSEARPLKSMIASRSSRCAGRMLIS